MVRGGNAGDRDDDARGDGEGGGGDEPTVFAHGIAVAIMTASVHTGRPPAQICADLDVQIARVTDPLVRFPHGDLVRVWRTLDAQIDGFGLLAARVASTSPQSLGEYAVANAPTVRAALGCFIRLQRLFHDASAHEAVIGPNEYVVRLRLAPPYALPHATGDFLAALNILRTRAWLRDATRPLAVRLTRPSLDAPALAQEMFGCPISVGHDAVEIAWPRAMLDEKLPAADPALYALLVRQLEEALRLAPGPSGAPALPVMREEQRDLVLALRRHFLTALPRGDVGIDEAAEAVGVSARSLQRRLAERETSFQAILDDSRRDLAMSLLRARRGNLVEIALMTGFSDQPAFARAFRRWTGTTPARWATANAV